MSAKKVGNRDKAIISTNVIKPLIMYILFTDKMLHGKIKSIDNNLVY